MKVKKVSLSSPGYPERLRCASSPPKALYVLGDIEKLTRTRTVGVVGSRAITPYGRQVTTSLVSDLASHGIGVVSGLALGVDAIAHIACLDAGGYTVAVLPCGLDQIHPATNRNLAIRILENGGALVSEYPSGTTPFKQNFVARNRIVAGLSDALLITEASERSGSLHTANFALEQGKPVAAVPGPITTNTSRGTNSLIKSGAQVVTDVGDILDTLGLDSQTQRVDILGANPAETTVLDLLRAGHSDINDLQTRSKLSVEEFNQTLTMLEISGKVRALGGGHWSIG
ncbi:DNA-processing protein DprA [Candidatus Saccharibacteria bacterium]|nr:DNA-processing protein DprA [Candidatus Saccharibacteria bacterium]